MSATEILIREAGTSFPKSFDVDLIEGVSRTSHRVTLQEKDYQSWTAGRVPPGDLVQAAFRFLLDREEKEAILSQFDLAAITQYFPEFGGKISGYLPGRSSSAAQ